MRTSDDRLLPCPFCGGRAMLLKDHKKLGIYAACSACYVCTETSSKDGAAAAWNRRIPTED